MLTPEPAGPVPDDLPDDLRLSPGKLVEVGASIIVVITASHTNIIGALVELVNLLS